MFKEARGQSLFTWADLGNIEEGRPHLGSLAPVVVYRLMQFSTRDVLITKFGVEKSREVLVEAGKIAGTEFCKNVLNAKLNLGEFVADLQVKLRDLKIGVIKMEKTDLDKMEFVLTVSEDLDCSGLPMSDETVCDYDEGFIAGIISTYTGRKFIAKEVDCWASGARICRFVVSPLD